MSIENKQPDERAAFSGEYAAKRASEEIGKQADKLRETLGIDRATAPQTTVKGDERAPEFDAKHISLKQRGAKLILTLELDGVEGAPRYIVTPVNPAVVRAAVPQAGTRVDVQAMVDRFLGWKLPRDFGPDAGITFTPPSNPDWWPVGTNLLTADQARQMFEYVLNGAAAQGGGQ